MKTDLARFMSDEDDDAHNILMLMKMLLLRILV